MTKILCILILYFAEVCLILLTVFRSIFADIVALCTRDSLTSIIHVDNLAPTFLEYITRNIRPSCCIRKALGTAWTSHFLPIIFALSRTTRSRAWILVIYTTAVISQGKTDGIQTNDTIFLDKPAGVVRPCTAPREGV